MGCSNVKRSPQRFMWEMKENLVFGSATGERVGYRSCVFPVSHSEHSSRYNRTEQAVSPPLA